mmetsp:Transcript_8601/g.11353  ORF Transcript_8601/g.11353 Transcript_8601/m.11353 type:complete len:254 (+) Transcript_8601:232-993(+)
MFCLLGTIILFLSWWSSCHGLIFPGCFQASSLHHTAGGIKKDLYSSAQLQSYLKTILASSSSADDPEDLPYERDECEIIPVPTFQEMMAWAAETDERIRCGEQLGLGAAETAAGRPLDASQAQDINVVVNSLRRRVKNPREMDLAELDRLSDALERVSEVVQSDTEYLEGQLNECSTEELMKLASSQESSFLLDKIKEAWGSPQPKKTYNERAYDEVYGNTEVRDKIYLYTWSLVEEKLKSKGWEPKIDEEQY